MIDGNSIVKSVQPETLKAGAAGYVASMREGDGWGFRFCARRGASLIGSSLAAMLEGFLGVLRQRPQRDRLAWAEWINAHQRQDGWYDDEDIAAANLRPGYGRDRALLHRTRHALLALYALGARPRYPFAFVRQWLGADRMRGWYEGLDLSDYW